MPAVHASNLGSHIADGLLADRSSLAFRADAAFIRELCGTIFDPTGAGLARTRLKAGSSDWNHWVAWCERVGTAPWRLDLLPGSGPPMREQVLQAGFIRFAHIRQSARPRNGKPVADPRSAAKSLAVVRKMHEDRGFHMPLSKLVAIETKKLLNEFVARYDRALLIPQRKEPFTRE